MNEDFMLIGRRRGKYCWDFKSALTSLSFIQYNASSSRAAEVPNPSCLMRGVPFVCPSSNQPETDGFCFKLQVDSS